MVEHACDPSSGVEARGSEIHGHSQLHSKLKASLSYLRLRDLKTKSIWGETDLGVLYVGSDRSSQAGGKMIACSETGP